MKLLSYVVSVKNSDTQRCALRTVTAPSEQAARARVAEMYTGTPWQITGSYIMNQSSGLTQ